MFSKDVQAVVFAAGRGSRMTQMIGNVVPKCLLKVCGNPLIFYPLKTLASYGLSDALVIIQEREDVKEEVEKIGKRLGIRIDFLIVQEDADDFGTFQSLRHLMTPKISNKTFSKQKKDFLLISCDTITDVSLQKFVNFHKTFSAGCTALFVKHFVPTLAPGLKFPGAKNKIKQERDIIGIKPSNKQLLFLASEADFDDELSIPVDVLKASPHTKVLSSLLDAHVYLIRRDILEKYINDASTSDFLSVKGEFIPFLISEQLKNFDASLEVSNLALPPAGNLTLYGFMEPEKHCQRVHTILTYSMACKSVDWLKQAFPNDINVRGRDKDKAARIASSAKLIATQVGDLSKVGEKVKLTNVIAMDDVKFEDNATVENSIISAHAIIGTGASVKDCVVGPGYQVIEGGRFSNEYLTVSTEAFFDD